MGKSTKAHAQVFQTNTFHNYILSFATFGTKRMILPANLKHAASDSVKACQGREGTVVHTGLFFTLTRLLRVFTLSPT